MTSVNGSTHGKCDRPVADPSPEATAETEAGKQSSDPFTPLLMHLSELREYLIVYCSTQFDEWKVRLEAMLVQSALNMVTGLFAASVIIFATGLLLDGLAAGLGEFCGGRIWLGRILVGGGALTFISIFVRRAASLRQTAQFTTMAEHYDLRKQRERAEFGTDVAERAGNTPQ